MTTTSGEGTDFSVKKVPSYSKDQLAEYYARFGDRLNKLMRLETYYRDQGEIAERSGDFAVASDFRSLQAAARNLAESVAKDRATLKVEYDLRDLD
ncbi:hypothetical protein IM25_23810 (plasmid) [Rhodococcus sp. p52]|uniref:hypothetical protein n=1 Tax=Rhodococcus sp. p52 TaxID=935199 RepID=UPI00051A6FE5|nr:hypothetical protein [Rhodococcus sp. p52]AOD24695.1 hypothetical protein IM25_23365 [Rhodococcus sp. p52]AOD24765.1 hypothetical protein IM25_23810 [Rhodococcus sp. p52]